MDGNPFSAIWTVHVQGSQLVRYGGGPHSAQWQIVPCIYQQYSAYCDSAKTPRHGIHLIENNLLSFSLDNADFFSLGHGQSRTGSRSTCRFPSFSSLILLWLWRRELLVSALLLGSPRPVRSWRAIYSFALSVWCLFVVFAIRGTLSVVRLGSLVGRTGLLLVPVRAGSLGRIFRSVLNISEF